MRLLTELLQVQMRPKLATREQEQLVTKSEINATMRVKSKLTDAEEKREASSHQKLCYNKFSTDPCNH